MLKPVLARGAFQSSVPPPPRSSVSTWQKDPAFERRFQAIDVDQPSASDTVAYLAKLAPKYEEHHHVRYTQAALEAAASLSARYIQDRFLPDKAIHFHRRGRCPRSYRAQQGARARAEAEARVVELKAAVEEASAADDMNRAAEAKEQRADRRNRPGRGPRRLERRARREPGRHRCAPDRRHRLGDLGRARLVAHGGREPSPARLREALKTRIIGQDEAVAAVAKAIRRSRSPLKDPRRPAVPSSFWAPRAPVDRARQTLAEYLFGSKDCAYQL